MFLRQSAQLRSSSTGVSFQMSPLQEEWRRKARNFVEREVLPVSIKLDESAQFPSDIMRKAHAEGFITASIPKKFGGSGLSLLDSCILEEQFGWGDTSVLNSLFRSGLAISSLIMAGSSDQQAKYLRKYVDEPTAAALGVTESHTGSDVGAILTTARREGNQWIINGEKDWIYGIAQADWYYVLAKTDDSGTRKANECLSAFIVDKSTPGVVIGPRKRTLGHRAADVRSIKFNDVAVGQDKLIGQVGDGFRITMQIFDFNRPAVAAGGVGLAQRALDEATKYAGQRKTFGKTIDQHQAIQFKLADMVVAIETARLAYMKAAWQRDQAIPNTKTASIAKCLGKLILKLTNQST